MRPASAVASARLPVEVEPAAPVAGAAAVPAARCCSSCRRCRWHLPQELHQPRGPRRMAGRNSASAEVGGRIRPPTLPAAAPAAGPAAVAAAVVAVPATLPRRRAAAPMPLAAMHGANDQRRRPRRSGRGRRRGHRIHARWRRGPGGAGGRQDSRRTSCSKLPPTAASWRRRCPPRPATHRCRRGNWRSYSPMAEPKVSMTSAIAEAKTMPANIAGQST